MQPNQPGQQPNQTPPNPPQPASPTYAQPTQYPQQPAQPLTPNGMPSIDYLNQIAPKQKHSLGFSPKQLILLGGGLALALGVMLTLIITNTSGPNLSELGQRLLARTNAIEEVAKESQDNIQTHDLSTLNSSLTLQLASTSSSLGQSLSAAGINASKPSKDVMAEESNAELLDKLKDARLHGNFDDVYKRELSYQLTMLMVLMNDTQTKTSSQTLKDDLESSHQSIKALHTRLDQISSTEN